MVTQSRATPSLHFLAAVIKVEGGCQPKSRIIYLQRQRTCNTCPIGGNTVHNTNDDISEGVNSCNGGRGPASDRLSTTIKRSVTLHVGRGVLEPARTVSGWVTGPVGATKISRVFRPPLSTVSRLTTFCAVNEGGTTWQCSGMKIGKGQRRQRVGACGLAMRSTRYSIPQRKQAARQAVRLSIASV